MYLPHEERAQLSTLFWKILFIIFERMAEGWRRRDENRKEIIAFLGKIHSLALWHIEYIHFLEDWKNFQSWQAETPAAAWYTIYDSIKSGSLMSIDIDKNHISVENGLNFQLLFRLKHKHHTRCDECASSVRPDHTFNDRKVHATLLRRFAWVMQKKNCVVSSVRRSWPVSQCKLNTDSSCFLQNLAYFIYDTIVMLLSSYNYMRVRWIILHCFRLCLFRVRVAPQSAKRQQGRLSCDDKIGTEKNRGVQEKNQPFFCHGKVTNWVHSVRT